MMPYITRHASTSRTSAKVSISVLIAGIISLLTCVLAEARKLMSVEHKALGYRPPPGSLAAEAQAEAAKHPQTSAQVTEEQIRLAALADAERIKQERERNGVDLSAVSESMFASGMSTSPRANCSQLTLARSCLRNTKPWDIVHHLGLWLHKLSRLQ